MSEQHPPTSSVPTVNPAVAQHPSNYKPLDVDHRFNALVYGLIGLIIPVLGFVFGPLAISQANKGSSTQDTSAVKVLGVLALILGILTIVGIVAYFALVGLFITQTIPLEGV